MLLPCMSCPACMVILHGRVVSHTALQGSMAYNVCMCPALLVLSQCTDLANEKAIKRHCICAGVPAQGRASGGGQRLREDVRVHVPWMAVRCANSCTMPCMLLSGVNTKVAVRGACILLP